MNDVVEMERVMTLIGEMEVRGAARWLRGLVLSLAACLGGCDRDAPPAPGPHPVGVVTVAAHRLPVSLALSGRVAAWRVAEVRPQVDGIVLRRRYTEGETVQAGAEMYLIDPAPYRAALDEARGRLEVAKAAATQAHRTAKRYRALLNTKYISPQDVDQADAQAQQADADVQSARAAVDAAAISLGYTSVRAPVSGVTGMSDVTEGALVSNGQAQAMTVIQQLDPVYVDLTQDSDGWLSLQQALHDGSITPVTGRVPVRVTAGDGASSHTVACSLLFSDVTVDTGTGSLLLRAQCPNAGHTLLPGMFVQAVVSPGERRDALTVPQQAVTRTPEGQATVMVVDRDGKAQVRPVRVTDAAGKHWRVTQGLTAGERVVVTGQLMLRPGMPVKAVEVPDA